MEHLDGLPMQHIRRHAQQATAKDNKQYLTMLHTISLWRQIAQSGYDSFFETIRPQSRYYSPCFRPAYLNLLK